MQILKWACFILLCLDVLFDYFLDRAVGMKLENTVGKKLGVLIGLLLGLAARIFVLYGAATCWL